MNIFEQKICILLILINWIQLKNSIRTIFDIEFEVKFIEQFEIINLHKRHYNS